MTSIKTKQTDFAKILDNIIENLEHINAKLDRLVELNEDFLQTRKHEKESEALDVMTLLSLPDHLRKTAMIISKLNRATASQVAKESGRARAVESGYLNRLVIMGYINKMRDGRDVLFYVE